MDILAALSSGDRRSIGRANEVVAHVLEKPDSVRLLIGALSDMDPVIRMRAVDALEKVSVSHNEWLDPHAQDLIGFARNSGQQEVRWHMAQILPRLALSGPQRLSVTRIFFDYLEDDSKIVRAFAMTALAQFAVEDPHLRARVVPLLEKA